MVSVQDIRNQIEQQRRQFSQAEQNARRGQVTLTAEQQRRATPQQLALIRRSNAQRAQGLSQIQQQRQQFEQQAQDIERSIAQNARQARAFEQAEKLIREGNIGAARGDPDVTRAINTLRKLGARTPQQVAAEARTRLLEQTRGLQRLESGELVVPAGASELLQQTVSAPVAVDISQTESTGSIDIRELPNQFRQQLQQPVNPEVLDQLRQPNPSLIARAGEIIQESNVQLAQDVTIPAAAFIERRTGIDPFIVADAVAQAPPGINIISPDLGTVRRGDLEISTGGITFAPEVRRGIVIGAADFAINQPATAGLIGAAGFATGALAPTVSAGLVSLLGPSTAAAAQVGTGIALGTGLAIQTGTELAAAPGPRARGEILGRTAVQAGLFSAGTQLGLRVPLQSILRQQPALLRDIRGRTGRNRQKQKQVEADPRRTRADIERLAASFEEEFIKAGRPGVQKKLKGLVNRLTNRESRQGFGRFLEELRRRDLIRDFVYNEETGELFFIGESPIQPLAAATTTPTSRPLTSGAPPRNLLLAEETQFIASTPETQPGPGLITRTPSILSITGQTVTAQPVTQVSTQTPLAGTTSLNLLGTSQQQDSTQNQVSAQTQTQTQIPSVVQLQRQFLQQGLTQTQSLSLALVQRARLQQSQRLQTRQVSRRGRRLRSRPPRNPPLIPIPGFGNIPVLTTNGQTRTRNLKQLYDVFVKKGGKEVKIANDLPRNRALRFGARRVQNTLRASFTIKPDRKGTKKDIKKFTPSQKVFRDFKIVKGKRVQVKDTFIERRKFRLDSKSEVAAIKRAKRRKKK